MLAASVMISLAGRPRLDVAQVFMWTAALQTLLRCGPEKPHGCVSSPPNDKRCLTRRRGCVISAGVGFPFVPRLSFFPGTKTIIPTPTFYLLSPLCRKQYRKAPYDSQLLFGFKSAGEEEEEKEAISSAGEILSHFSCRSTSLPHPLPLHWISLQRCHHQVQTPFDC